MKDRPPNLLRFGFQSFDVTRLSPECLKAGHAAHVVRSNMPASRIRTRLAHAAAANLNTASAGRRRRRSARRPAESAVITVLQVAQCTVFSAAMSRETSLDGSGM